MEALYSDGAFATGAYYGFCFAVLALLAGLIVSVRQYMWLSYCGQSLFFLIYFAALDGHLNALLGLPPSTVPVVAGIAGGIACAWGYALCGLLLRKEHRLNRLRPALLFFAGASLLSPLLLLLMPPATFHRVLGALFWLMVAMQPLPPITWFFLSGWARNVVMPTVVAIVVAIALSSLFGAGDGILTPGSSSGVRRTIVIWLVVAGATTMLAMTGIIQRARIRSSERALVAAKRELTAVRAQQSAERDMRRARELAHQRSEQLASAAHDMKQPLLALRTSARLLEEQNKRNEPVKEPRGSELLDAIDYVESLAANYLQVATDDRTTEEEPVAAEEQIKAQLILNSMEAMFASDAAAAGIALKVMPSRLTLLAPPLALMRVSANCVSNAINHSGGNRVVIGWRRRGAHADLWVADNGNGLEPQVAEHIFDANIKGSESAGHGLGLAIVAQLAREHGWQPGVASSAGVGTLLSIAGIKSNCRA